MQFIWRPTPPIKMKFNNFIDTPPPLLFHYIYFPHLTTHRAHKHLINPCRACVVILFLIDWTKSARCGNWFVICLWNVHLGWFTTHGRAIREQYCRNWCGFIRVLHVCRMGHTRSTSCEVNIWFLAQHSCSSHDRMKLTIFWNFLPYPATFKCALLQILRFIVCLKIILPFHYAVIFVSHFMPTIHSN